MYKDKFIFLPSTRLEIIKGPNKTSKNSICFVLEPEVPTHSLSNMLESGINYTVVTTRVGKKGKERFQFKRLNNVSLFHKNEEKLNKTINQKINYILRPSNFNSIKELNDLEFLAWIYAKASFLRNLIVLITQRNNKEYLNLEVLNFIATTVSRYDSSPTNSLVHVESLLENRDNVIKKIRYIEARVCRTRIKDYLCYLNNVELDILNYLNPNIPKETTIKSSGEFFTEDTYNFTVPSEHVPSEQQLFYVSSDSSELKFIDGTSLSEIVPPPDDSTPDAPDYN